MAKSPGHRLSLYEAFREVPDPRDPRGVRFSLASVLTLAAAAILCGAKGPTAIAQWGRDHKELLAELGFTRQKAPCTGALHYIFRALDMPRVEKVLTRWLLAQGVPPTLFRQLHMDGKTLRGSKDGDAPGVHLLAAYAAWLGTALSQLRVNGKTNEHKTALRLLNLIPLAGVIVTGDAAFAQRDVSRKVRQRGGHYFWTVKDNQPQLKADIAAAFQRSSPPGGPDRSHADRPAR